MVTNESIQMYPIIVSTLFLCQYTFMLQSHFHSVFLLIVLSCHIVYIPPSCCSVLYVVISCCQNRTIILNPIWWMWLTVTQLSSSTELLRTESIVYSSILWHNLCCCHFSQLIWAYPPRWLYWAFIHDPYLLVCLSVYLSICLSICLSMCLSCY